MAVSIHSRLQVWEGQSHTLAMQDPCDSEDVLGTPGEGRETLSGVSGWRGSSVCRAAFPGWSAQDSAMAVDHDHEPLARAGGLESVPSVPCGCCRGSQKEEDWSLRPTLGARC